MSRAQRDRLKETLGRASPRGRRSVEEMRAGFRAFSSKFKGPEGIRTTVTSLGRRPALRIEPRDQPAAVGTILYFHGGGFVVGSPETALSLSGNLVVKTGFALLSLDYRLAPEFPFPAAIEDGLAAYRALLDGGTPASSIAFAGDSAGGGLSVTTCLAAREAKVPLPAAIVAFSPALDARHTGDSMRTKADLDPFFTPDSIATTDELYLAGQSPDHPWLTPALSADLTGFPPLLLQAGTNELLLDDATRLATRAREAGADVILDVTADVPHVFQTFVGVLDEADHAMDRAALFLKQHIR